MSKVFGIVRGSYKALSSDVELKPSIINIDGIGISAGQGILVQNFSIQDVEKHGMIQCFNNVTHIYAFGHDPEQSGFSISYLVFLGKCKSDSSQQSSSGMREGGSYERGYNGGEGFENNEPDYSTENLAKVIKAYNDLKVSKKKSTVVMTIGENIAVVGIILSVQVNVEDSELNTLSVTISGKSLGGIQC